MRIPIKFKSAISFQWFDHGRWDLKCWDLGIHLESDEVCYLDLTVWLWRYGFSVSYIRPTYRGNS